MRGNETRMDGAWSKTGEPKTAKSVQPGHPLAGKATMKRLPTIAGSYWIVTIYTLCALTVFWAAVSASLCLACSSSAEHCCCFIKCFFEQTNKQTPWHYAMQCPWSRSANWCLANGYRNGDIP